MRLEAPQQSAMLQFQYDKSSARSYRLTSLRPDPCTDDVRTPRAATDTTRGAGLSEECRVDPQSLPCGSPWFTLLLPYGAW